MNVFTLAEMSGPLGFPLGAQARQALALGLSLRFLGPRWGRAQVAARLRPMLAAVDKGQYEFYFDAMGRETGFVDWTLAPDGALRIHDFFAFRGSLRTILADLRDRVLARHDAATYIRHKPRLRITKHVARQDNTSFFRAAPQGDRTGPGLTRNPHALDSHRRSFADAVELGECLAVLQRCDPHGRSPLWAGAFPLGDLVTLRQYRLYRDEAGRPAGLVTWAWLSPRTLERLAATPLHLAHVSEWNEGSVLCLCDVLATAATQAQIMEDLGGDLLPEHDDAVLYLGPDAAQAAFAEPARRGNRTALAAWVARQAAHLAAGVQA
ncbi:toxin-activating lysine-acyltransferase [Pseudoduganella chitinolytica]|uniref:RTX toxin-activating lysine-acyltransferase n=1 Tax=Pseudoduganella chitinolytica TaxID=34070 RepID=A0ABY8B995_9BURK|nr:toxin-activating lysine-acyltransferase [Pseudoduganella chitinolytica]WEF31566.1 toxin-activating lysine-acyltransferase [Pseudoduganella chitinolytica]